MSLPEEEEGGVQDTLPNPSLDQASPQPPNLIIPTDPHPSTLPAHAIVKAALEPQLIPTEDPGPIYPAHDPEGDEPTILPEVQQPSPQARHFPPPGIFFSLVLQATVDCSATSPDTNGLNARPGAGQTTTRSRNRLSGLLRPRSTSSRPPSTNPTVVQQPELGSPPISESSSDVTTPIVHSVESLAGAHPPATENRVPSSMDVLITSLRWAKRHIPLLFLKYLILLSVTAAATAESLLTGSCVSSGLTPPNPSISISSLGFTLPASSPPRVSLPNVPTYPRIPSAHPDLSATRTVERMRQAWGTIRERLGLRPSAPPPDHAWADLNNPSGDANSRSVTPDARHLMLAEMARAVNIGLGLNGLAGMAPAVPSMTGTAEHEPGDEAGGVNAVAEGDPTPQLNSHTFKGIMMPPEVERFLVDIQADLHAALTQAQGVSDSDSELRQEEHCDGECEDADRTYNL